MNGTPRRAHTGAQPGLRTQARRAGPDQAPRPGRAQLWLLGAAATVALILSLATAATTSALTARVTNSTNTTATAPFFTCTGADTAVGPAATTFLYRLLETGGTTAVDTSGNTRPGTYTATGITYSQPGPCPRDTATAITLNGSAGSISGPATTATAPATFTIEMWFQTTTTRGGKLIGYGNVRTGSSASYDRHLYMSNTGQVYFGVYPNAVKTISTTTAYNDGRWHHVAASLSPTTGMALYLDGQLAATDPATTTAQAYSGFWRIGQDNLNGWTAAPTSTFFAGSLAYTAAYTTVLTPTQISDHYTAGR
jgi:hypothetical protein